jgi:CheY-like chemotaxis protein
MQVSNIFNALEPVQPKIILFVDDSDEDYEMFLRAVKKTGMHFSILRCETGEQALDILTSKDPSIRTVSDLPSLILLDLNLPGIDGLQVLNTIKTDQQLKLIPVVIFSTSSNPKDIRRCYQSGANAYVLKPMDVSLLQKYVQSILTHWLDVNVTCFQIA